MNKRGTWKLSPAHGTILRDHAHLGYSRSYRTGQVLYEQGSNTLGFHLVLSGMVQVSMITIDGFEVILEFMGPDTLLGEGAAFPGTPKFARAVALKDTQTIEFVLHDMAEICRNHPDFAATILEVSSHKLSIMMRRFVRLASRKPEDRILELFDRFAGQFGSPHPDGLLINFQLTHEQIAAMTATTRVTVTRTLQRLRRSGDIKEDSGKIVLTRTPSVY